MIIEDKEYSVEEFVLDIFPELGIEYIHHDYNKVRGFFYADKVLEVIYTSELEMRYFEAELKKHRRCKITIDKSPVMKRRTTIGLSEFMVNELDYIGSKNNSYEEIIAILLSTYYTVNKEI